MARKSKKQIAVESAYAQIICKERELKTALKIEELTQIAFGAERLLYNTIISNLEIAYDMWKNISDGGDDVVEYLVQFGEGLMNYIKTNEYINKYIVILLDACVAKNEVEEDAE